MHSLSFRGERVKVRTKAGGLERVRRPLLLNGLVENYGSFACLMDLNLTFVYTDNGKR